jgi:undecaprenyl-diphosphatase
MTRSAPAGGGAAAVAVVQQQRNSLRRLVIVAALVVLALVWAAAVDMRAFRGTPGVPLDATWASTIAAVRTPPLIAAAQVLAWLGVAPGSFVPAVAVALFLWWRRSLAAAVTFAVVALLSEANVNLMKSVDLRPRPGGALWSGIGSFPSGHTAYAAVIAVTLGMLFHRVAVWIAGFALVVVMALSRTVLDAHWLTDTFAGAACGAALTVLVWLVADSIGPRSLRPLRGASR